MGSIGEITGRSSDKWYGDETITWFQGISLYSDSMSKRFDSVILEHEMQNPEVILEVCLNLPMSYQRLNIKFN